MRATVKIKLQPLLVPNYVRTDLLPQALSDGVVESPTVALTSLDDDALEELAYAFLIEFYTKAGKVCPFYRPARDEKAR